MTTLAKHRKPGRWRKWAAVALIAGAFGAGYGTATAVQSAPRPAVIAEQHQPAKPCKPVVIVRQAPPRFVLAPHVLHVWHVLHVAHAAHMRAARR